MNKGIFSMDSVSKLNSFLQTIGAIGIIASLIFVGIELRQTQKIALNSQNQSRTETLIRSAEFFYDNGLKLFGPDGLKLSDNIQKKIENIIDKDVSNHLS